MSEKQNQSHILRSIWAVLAGFIAVAILSVATDLALQATGIFPPLSHPEMFTTPLLLLATAYRSLYGIAGGYITARLAPEHPVQHALWLGAVGFAAGIVGLIVMWGVGPAWYPIALILVALPCSWLGGKLRSHQLA